MGTGVLISRIVEFAAYALAFWYGSQLILNDPTFPTSTVFTVSLT
jgi:hypothetical protein